MVFPRFNFENIAQLFISIAPLSSSSS